MKAASKLLIGHMNGAADDRDHDVRLLCLKAFSNQTIEPTCFHRIVDEGIGFEKADQDFHYAGGIGSE